MKTLILFFFSVTVFAKSPTELSRSACADGKYLRQCFKVEQNKCESDFLLSYKGCVQIKGEKLALDCVMKDLTNKWGLIKNQQIQNCQIKNFVGDEK